MVSQRHAHLQRGMGMQGRGVEGGGVRGMGKEALHNTTHTHTHTCTCAPPGLTLPGMARPSRCLRRRLCCRCCVQISSQAFADPGRCVGRAATDLAVCVSACVSACVSVCPFCCFFDCSVCCLAAHVCDALDQGVLMVGPPGTGKTLLAKVRILETSRTKGAQGRGACVRVCVCINGVFTATH